MEKNLEPAFSDQQPGNLQEVPGQPHRGLVQVVLPKERVGHFQVAERPGAVRPPEKVLAEVHTERALEVLDRSFCCTRARLQGARDGGVVLLAQLLVQRATKRLLDLMVIEAVGATCRPDQAMAPLYLPETLQSGNAGHAEHVADQGRVELEPATAGHIQKVALLLRQVGHPGVDEVEHRRWNLDVLDHLRRHPGPVRLLGNKLPFAQPPDDLEREERVPVGLLRDLEAEVLGQTLAIGRRRSAAC